MSNVFIVISSIIIYDYFIYILYTMNLRCNVKRGRYRARDFASKPECFKTLWRNVTTHTTNFSRSEL
jgi:hypothetical protein